jgi:hypothetical protein
VDGNAIGAEWNRRKAYLTNKWKKKTPRRRPNAIAEPPLLTVPAQQLAAPAAQPLPAVILPVPLPPVQPPPAQPPANATQIMPESPDTLAGGSYPFALLNSREYDILPTRGQIAKMRKDMENQGWKFVRVLYQTQMETENPADGFADLYPFKSVLLYVLPDENGQITDVSIQNHLLSEAY